MIEDPHIPTTDLLADPPCVIRIEHLFKSFFDNEVLKGYHMDLFEGENLVVIGKSGSGKSVMIKCLIGLIPADEGRIEVLGNDIVNMDRDALDELRTDVGFLFQGSALYDSMTVRENLEFPMRRHKNKLGEDYNSEELVREVLRSVGLEDTIDMMPAELSGGMQRRIALARTLILKPKIILYDEPTSGLDPITAKEIIELIMEIKEVYHTSSLIITHDMDCARVIADRVIILIDGQNYAEGTYEELASSKDPQLQAFFK